MVNTIDMKDLRYLNLFGKITRVQTKYCFMYNNAVVFAVPRVLISKALGKNASNLKRMNDILKKRIKVVAIPEGEKDIRRFIESIVSPLTFKELEITPEEIILTAGSQSKAALIGRNKRRFLEMKEILKDFFDRDFRIV
jgi:transcription antitermination factor NusA-like protein